ncbi:MAG: hypothetical protein U1C57_01995 [Candidatus Doudnabacteria bacterium]|nr:hypothetical protein [Candidatus Doudnabacteria bacterium]
MATYDPKTGKLLSGPVSPPAYTPIQSNFPAPPEATKFEMPDYPQLPTFQGPQYPSPTTYKAPSVPTAPTYTAPDYPQLPGFVAPEYPGAVEYKKPVMGTLPKYVSPTAPKLPTYYVPKWSEEAIASKTQSRAASGIRKLRTAIQESMVQRNENPNVQRMTLRDALAGYGQGLEDVMSGASKSATAEYGQEYGYRVQGALVNYQSAVQEVQQKYAGQVDERRAEYNAALDQVRQQYAADISAENLRVVNETRAKEGQFTTQYNQAMTNYQSQVNTINAQFAGATDEKKTNYLSALDQANKIYAANQEAEKIRVETENRYREGQYSVQYKDAVVNYQNELLKVQTTYSGKVEVGKTNYLAAIGAASQKYAAAVKDEEFRIGEQRNVQQFDMLFSQYLETLGPLEKVRAKAERKRSV